MATAVIGFTLIASLVALAFIILAIKREDDPPKPRRRAKQAETSTNTQ